MRNTMNINGKEVVVEYKGRRSGKNAYARQQLEMYLMAMKPGETVNILRPSVDGGIKSVKVTRNGHGIEEVKKLPCE